MKQMHSESIKMITKQMSMTTVFTAAAPRAFELGHTTGWECGKEHKIKS